MIYPLRRLLTGLCLPVLLATALQAKTPKPDPEAETLDKIVVLRQGGQIIGAGFVVMIKDRPCVVTAIGNLRLSEAVKITDLHNKNLPVSRMFMPRDDRGVIIFELAKKDESWPALTIGERLPDKLKVRDRVLLFGVNPDTNTVTVRKGVVQGIGPQGLDFKVKANMSGGGPIIHDRSGSLLGVAADTQELPGRKEGKRNKIDVPAYGIRLDGIAGQLQEISDEQLAERANALNRLREELTNYRQDVDQFTFLAQCLVLAVPPQADPTQPDATEQKTIREATRRRALKDFREDHPEAKLPELAKLTSSKVDKLVQIGMGLQKRLQRDKARWESGGGGSVAMQRQFINAATLAEEMLKEVEEQLPPLQLAKKDFDLLSKDLRAFSSQSKGEFKRKEKF